MGILYELGIRLFFFIAKIKSIFDSKTKKWIKAQNNIIYKSQINKAITPIWFHCASLGEFESVKYLIDKISKEKVIVSFFSPSGYEVVKAKYPDLTIHYLPLDTRKNAEKFVRSINPKCLIISESDLWYNHITAVQRNDVPVLMVSSSFRKKQFIFSQFGKPFLKVLLKLDHLFVKDKESEELLKSKGFENLSLGGDLRIDQIINRKKTTQNLDKIHQFTSGEDFVLIGASLHPKDLDLLASCLKKAEFSKVILVPHDKDDFEFEKVNSLFEQEPYKYSELTVENINQAKILWIDQFGLLFDIYKYVDFAFVGGGFDEGIHNVIEPLVFGVPSAFGPNFEKFRIIKSLINRNLVRPITNEGELLRCLEELKANKNKELYQKSVNKFIEQNQGATQLVLDYLQKKKII